MKKLLKRLKWQLKFYAKYCKTEKGGFWSLKIGDDVVYVIDANIEFNKLVARQAKFMGISDDDMGVRLVFRQEIPGPLLNEWVYPTSMKHKVYSLEFFKASIPYSDTKRYVAANRNKAIELLHDLNARFATYIREHYPMSERKYFINTLRKQFHEAMGILTTSRIIYNDNK